MAPSTRTRHAFCVLLIAVSACSRTEADEGGSTTSPPAVPSPSGPPRSDPVSESFPTAASAGIPPNVELVPWEGDLSLSNQAPQRVEEVQGRECSVFEGFDIDLGSGGDYLYIDIPCVVFRKSRFRTDGEISNTSAMVQQASTNELLIIEQCDFDGGPAHQRGVQADFGDVVVTASQFTRFGNAAVEMNDRSGERSFTAIDNFVEESSGWAQDAHVDGFQVGAGGAVTIRHNTVLIAPYGGDVGDTGYVSNSALGLWAEIGDVRGPVVVEDNLLAGGGFVIYLEQKPPFRFDARVSVTRNVIDRRFTTVGGIWGVLAPSALPSDLVWTDNQFDDGTPIDLRAALSGG